MLPGQCTQDCDQSCQVCKHWSRLPLVNVWTFCKLWKESGLKSKSYPCTLAHWPTKSWLLRESQGHGNEFSQEVGKKKRSFWVFLTSVVLLFQSLSPAFVVVPHLKGLGAKSFCKIWCKMMQVLRSEQGISRPNFPAREVFQRLDIRNKWTELTWQVATSFASFYNLRKWSQQSPQSSQKISHLHFLEAFQAKIQLPECIGRNLQVFFRYFHPVTPFGKLAHCKILAKLSKVDQKELRQNRPFKVEVSLATSLEHQTSDSKMLYIRFAKEGCYFFCMKHTVESLLCQFCPCLAWSQSHALHVFRDDVRNDVAEYSRYCSCHIVPCTNLEPLLHKTCAMPVLKPLRSCFDTEPSKFHVSFGTMLKCQSPRKAGRTHYLECEFALFGNTNLHLSDSMHTLDFLHML